MSNRAENQRLADQHDQQAATLRAQLRTAQERGDQESVEVIKADLGTAEDLGRWYRRLT